MRKQIANIITSSRILCSICLLLSPVFSVAFYIMYLFCGITDMVDGTIARKTKSVSETGARLDTVADIVFVAVCFEDSTINTISNLVMDLDCCYNNH